MARVFIPGFAARPSFYAEALGGDWIVHEPPAYRSASTFGDRVAALCATIDDCDTPVTLAGHSMGAALAVAAAVRRPDAVERVVLVAPAGLPLTKPVLASLRDFLRQVARSVYPLSEVLRELGSIACAPRSAWQLARSIRSLDLRESFGALRLRGVRCDVIGCAGDTLTPVAHCREIASLAGARYREITAQGGHAWLFVEPAAFTGIVD